MRRRGDSGDESPKITPIVRGNRKFKGGAGWAALPRRYDRFFDL